jgi:hypothetical protein
MSKYVSRIMDDVYDAFSNHFQEADDRAEFLTELIEELNNELEAVSECEENIKN